MTIRQLIMVETYREQCKIQAENLYAEGNEESAYALAYIAHAIKEKLNREYGKPIPEEDDTQ